MSEVSVFILTQQQSLEEVDRDTPYLFLSVLQAKEVRDGQDKGTHADYGKCALLNIT